VTRVIVLVKDFDTAKQRLSPVLDPPARRRLAIANAERAVRAGAEVGPVLVVAGSEEAAALGRQLGADVLLEAEPSGQNPAAAAGIAQALREGAEEVLVVSSDLPLVTSAALGLLPDAADGKRPVVVAAAATGRGGTNALFLRPPDAVGLHFGDRSLAKFQADAAERHVTFVVIDDDQLALDLDEPGDL
jgi:2-phospho-L-lactate guanylyltransferase